MSFLLVNIIDFNHHSTIITHLTLIFPAVIILLIMQYLQLSLVFSSVVSYASARALLPRDQSTKDVFAAVNISTFAQSGFLILIDNSIHVFKMAAVPIFIPMCSPGCMIYTPSHT